MTRAASYPHPMLPPDGGAAGVPFERRLPALPSRLPHWRDHDLPTLAEMLRRYGREGSVLSALPHQPELQRIDPRPEGLATHLADASAEQPAPAPQQAPEPFSEPLEGLQTREIHDDTVFSTLFGDLR